MKTVKYENGMLSGQAKNGCYYIETAVGSLDVGDVVVKEYSDNTSGSRKPRNPKNHVETFTVVSFGGEFYSDILGCDVARAYCDRVYSSTPIA
jgi:hypothetical protein